MVLVIVLWIVTLLAVMAGSFAYSMRVETRLATSAVERAQARAMAEAGVAYALAWQLDQEESRKVWLPNGDPHDWLFGGGRLRIQVTDANGLVNLNTADAELLKVLFAGVGVDSREQDRLVEAILEWRQPGELGANKAGSLPGRSARRTEEDPF
ncbi:MAG: type II secretion system protein GspK [Comamonadaceae bacterium]|nr:type II secretion system protein GspK [Comamonadaceae bacterium]